ncbi:hypothetical protein NVV94_12105 [Pseudomonas sp. LS1212]|uniref:hypothetical protein n=1 Tax=Pseudomonas sp. LS1212 TaxID=2972478 RepID=UPI00215CB740|nr:hypothetical protein [Pseudomonas sp. LS1212]UVJ46207.1 hypothetical protein NVV94_12105 [Pseudomonas sp. LS1212]
MLIAIIIDQESLDAFVHPALDLVSGCLIELEAPVQLELFPTQNLPQHSPAIDPDFT